MEQTVSSERVGVAKETMDEVIVDAILRLT